jgi:hypothetical protein
MGAILVGFTEFEQELLEASASLAKVTFNKNICTVQWDFVAEYPPTLQIRIDEDGEFFLTITSPDGNVTLDDEKDLFSNIISLLRELDTSLLSIIVEQMDEDKQEQGLLS